ncbi:MAG: bifunctional diaminohydroxyphosphoribosylaminopyrimidine deaminase/5-amino-6-(5-phosphoribosylamino)uracil reductase RibD [Flavobacteriaceae bacterium]
MQINTQEDLNNNLDLIYMERCLQLARKGLGTTSPNPMVGCVIVYNQKIIGEGWHHKAGEAHAEVNAIHEVLDKSLLKKSTLYVNLEPCSHYGKTPPCSNLIVKYKIPNVVVATLDPNPKVSGRGIDVLKASGCNVTLGVLEKEAIELNRRFITFHQKKRPYIILKWAQTKDKFIAPQNSKNTIPKVFWISNLKSQQLAHKWRSEEASILVGVNTVIADNPQLTTRNWKGKHPVRLILDPNNKTPKDTFVFSDIYPTLFFTKEYDNHKSGTKKNIVLSPYTIDSLMKYCWEKEYTSILVEGGQKTIQNFINNNLWDEARVFTSSSFLINGIKAPQLMREPYKKIQIRDNVLSLYQNQKDEL